MNFQQLALNTAQQVGLDPELFARVIGVESGWKQNAISPKGAIGLGQLMPETARDLGVDPNDPAQNLFGAATYLKQLMDKYKDPRLALAAYNAGPGNVDKYGGVPPFNETHKYINKILPNEQEPIVSALEPHATVAPPVPQDKPMINMPELSPLDKASADPMFQIGLALMGSPNFGTAIQQGLQTAQSIKQNQFDNKLRLAELNQGTEPTQLMRHMAVALDPNNPMSSLMRNYLLKSQAPTIVNQMPGSQGMAAFKPNDPDFLQWADPEKPGKEGYYKTDPTAPGGYRLVRTEGQDKADAAAYKAAGQAGVLEESSRVLNTMSDYIRENPNTSAVALAAQAAGKIPFVGTALETAAKRAGLIPEELEVGAAAVNQASAVIGNMLYGADVTDEQQQRLLQMVSPKLNESPAARRQRELFAEGIMKMAAVQGKLPKQQIDKFITEGQSLGLSGGQQSPPQTASEFFEAQRRKLGM